MKTDTTYTCDHCGKRFFDKSECVAHEEKHQKPIVPKFQDGDIVFRYNDGHPYQIVGDGVLFGNGKFAKYKGFVLLPNLEKILGLDDKPNIETIIENDIHSAYARSELEAVLEKAKAASSKIPDGVNVEKSFSLDGEIGTVVLSVTFHAQSFFTLMAKDTQ